MNIIIKCCCVVCKYYELPEYYGSGDYNKSLCYLWSMKPQEKGFENEDFSYFDIIDPYVSACNEKYFKVNENLEVEKE